MQLATRTQKVDEKIESFDIHGSSIVIEGTRTFFSHMLNRKKSTNPTFNKRKKEFKTLNNQLTTKNFSGGGRFIIS